MDKMLSKLIQHPNVSAIKCDKESYVKKVENRTNFKFPKSYRDFIGNYEFDSFCLAGIEFFGNSGAETYELNLDIFKDKILSKALLESGYIQFGRPETGSYDPICFNANKKGTEFEIVKIDHESILCNKKLKVAEVISPSFVDWLKINLNK